MAEAAARYLPAGAAALVALGALMALTTSINATMLVPSRVAIMLAGGYAQSENKNLIDLAFGMVAYTYGPLLGVLLAAILPGRRNIKGLFAGVIASVLMVTWLRPELGQLLDAIGLGGLAERIAGTQPAIAFPWFYPINAAITLAGACIPWGRK